jgi:predicted phage terminase large subunit-like protein
MFDSPDVIRSTALTIEQRKELAVLLQAAKQRGIEVNMDGLFKNATLVFPKDANGYYYKNDGKQYTPTENQDGFIQSAARFSLFFGSRGSGKTGAGIQKALRKIEMGFSGAILNPDFENFKISTWEEVRNWIPWKMVVDRHRYRENPEWEPQKGFSLAFRNGAKVFLRGLRDPGSARGPNINWLWYDEAGRDITGAGWKIANGAVRVGKDPQAWATATPSGVLHWMYEFFILKQLPEEIKKLLEEMGYTESNLIETFYGTMEDNKANLDPAFYVSMVSIYGDGWERQQEVEGKFVAQGGVRGNPSWFDGKVISQIPDDVIRKKMVRYWDLAATAKDVTGKKANDPDETVGTRLDYAPDGSDELAPGIKPLFFADDQVCGYWEWDAILEAIWQTAMRDGPLVEIHVEIEPGSGGKNQVKAVEIFMDERCKQRGMARFAVKGHRPEGDKVQRADIWFKEAKEGHIYLIAGKWVKPFLSQLGGFPLTTHDDKIDSMSGARLVCAPIIGWRNIRFKSIQGNNAKTQNDHASRRSRSGPAIRKL